MSNEEAIRQIEENIALIRDLDCTEYEMAIAALKREIPVEMADEYVNGYGNHKGECPSCHCTMLHPAKYCKFCGQRLKWRKDDE